MFQATAEIDAEIGGGRLRLVTEKEVKGAVFSIECLNNKRWFERILSHIAQ